MGRHAKEFKTKLMRFCIRATLVKACKIKLSERNYFNPEKPAHGDFSKLIENLLMIWIRGRIKPEAYRELMSLKDEKLVMKLDLKSPEKPPIIKPTDFPLDKSVT
jgi:hypothetical protein